LTEIVLLILAVIAVRAFWPGIGRRAMPPPRSAFDTRHDVDTDGEIPISRLGMPEDIAARAERYMPSDERVVEVAVAFAGIEPGRFSFVDLGCGKGRALIMAAQLGFRRLIGVEIVPELADIARANLARLGFAAEVHTEDAARFVFPPGPVVLFLFNPFKPATISAVIEALRAARSPELVVVYHAPDHGKLLDASGLLTRLGSPRGWGRRTGVAVWRGTDGCNMAGSEVPIQRPSRYANSTVEPDEHPDRAPI
jgi:SAM-dependent methyltransferase